MQTRGGARNQLPEAIARAVTIDGGGKRDSYEQPEEIYEMQSGQPRVLDFPVNNFGVDEINSVALLCPEHIKVTFFFANDQGNLLSA
jgi:hypothetical protein